MYGYQQPLSLSFEEVQQSTPFMAEDLASHSLSADWECPQPYPRSNLAVHMQYGNAVHLAGRYTNTAVGPAYPSCVLLVPRNVLFLVLIVLKSSGRPCMKVQAAIISS